MTAYVTIPVATVQNVLKLPNTALRYKPPMSPEEILALYRQYGIEPGGRKTASDEAAAAERGAPPLELRKIRLAHRDPTARWYGNFAPITAWSR